MVLVRWTNPLPVGSTELSVVAQPPSATAWYEVRTRVTCCAVPSARTMLITAAAAQLNVPAGELTTANHEVVHARSGRRVGYGALVPAAAKLPVPAKDTLRFKPKADWKFVGKETEIYDLTPIVTGTAQFGLDVHREGMAFASIEQVHDIEARQNYEQAVALGTDPERVMAAIRRVGRDNARTPMQWDESPEAGFTTGSPWLAVNPNHTEVNAEAALADPASVFHHYRRLVELRHTVPVVAHGDFEAVDAGHPAVFAFERAHEGERLLVMVNLSSVEHVPAFGADVAARWSTGAGEPGDVPILTNTIPDSPAPFDAPLAPWEARVYASGD